MTMRPKLTITHLAKAAKHLRWPLTIYALAALIEALAKLVEAVR